MRYLSIVAAVAGLLLGASVALADTPYITVQSLSPGASVQVSNRLSFSIVASSFFPVAYQLTDSFPVPSKISSVSVSNIDASGHFQWVPVASDVGTHTLTITATDGQNIVASTTQSITVLPAPSVVIQSVSATRVMPGADYTFSVTAPGFTNPQFVLSDDFGGSSVANSDLDPSGHFSWVPDEAQNGQHSISVYALDSLGHSASASQTVWVGAGSALIAQVVSTSSTIMPGTILSILVSGNRFSPTNFTVVDSATSSSVSNTDISTDGSFRWMPEVTDFGVHVLTFTGTVGNYGQSATTSLVITVLGPNGEISKSPALTTTVAPQIPAATASASSSVSHVVFSRYLAVGYQGSDVTALQQKLTARGIYSGPITGYFGALTRAAVMQFQKMNGLSQVGFVGPGTRAALNNGTQ